MKSSDSTEFWKISGEKDDSFVGRTFLTFFLSESRFDARIFHKIQRLQKNYKRFSRKSAKKAFNWCKNVVDLATLFELFRLVDLELLSLCYFP